MNKIDCGVCRDLLPLVRDGVAEQSSREAVLAHMAECQACAAMYEGEIPAHSEEQALVQVVKRLGKVLRVLGWIFVLAGILLCESVMQFGSLFFLGAVAVFRWMIGVVTNPATGKVNKAVALLCAGAVLWGIGWSANELFGNPLEKTRAEHHIQGYVEGRWEETDYYVESVGYTWSGSYEGEIRSKTDPEVTFTVSYRDGEIIYDTYDEDVLGIYE